MEPIKIYFTTDTHGYLLPTDYSDFETKPMGVISIAHEIQKNKNTLLIDGGDTIQGSPFTTYLHDFANDASLVAQVMNVIGYDYVTLGNHDFNNGIDYLKTYVNTLNAPVLCGNVQTNSDDSFTDPFHIVTLPNGIKIGLFGVVTDYVNVWEKADNLTPYQVTSPFESAKNSVEQLQSQAVDLIIGIYHGGFEVDLETGKTVSHTSENIAYKLCQNLDIDLLLTGHQHLSIYNQVVHGTQVIQAVNNATEYIEITITPQADGTFNYACISKKPQAVSPENELVKKIQPINDKVQTWLDQKIGELSRPLAADQHLKMALETPYLANFLNQVQLDFSGADISCTSLANDVKGIRQALTLRDIISTYIYPNTLAVLDVSGDVLKQALEQSASYFKVLNEKISYAEAFLKPKTAHYNYDYFSGIHYTIDLNQPVGNRVSSIQFEGKEIQPQDHFKLVMNNYRATGAGHYDFYAQCPVVAEYAITTSEMVADYIKNHQPICQVDEKHYYKVILPHQNEASAQVKLQE